MKRIFFIIFGLLSMLLMSSCGNGVSIATTSSKAIVTSKDEVKLYTIDATGYEHGKIILNKTMAKEGETITVTAVPDDGYGIQTNKITYSPKGSSFENYITECTFTMPSYDIKINAEFLELFTVNFILNGKIVYSEKVLDGSIPRDYINEVDSDYYLTTYYNDSSLTVKYYSTPIKSDTTIYVKRLLCPFNASSENKNSIEYSTAYANNDLLKYVVKNVKVSYYNAAYLKVSLKPGQMCMISTNTTYQNMSTYLMFSLAGDRGETLNGGTFNHFERTEDTAKHSVFIFSVTTAGDYYVAVTYSTEAISKLGVSFLVDFNYVFDATAIIE